MKDNRMQNIVKWEKECKAICGDELTRNFHHKPGCFWFDEKRETARLELVEWEVKYNNNGLSHEDEEAFERHLELCPGKSSYGNTRHHQDCPIGGYIPTRMPTAEETAIRHAMQLLNQLYEVMKNEISQEVADQFPITLDEIAEFVDYGELEVNGKQFNQEEMSDLPNWFWKIRD